MLRFDHDSNVDPLTPAVLGLSSRTVSPSDDVSANSTSETQQKDYSK
jgi:hypothetical protein